MTDIENIQKLAKLIRYYILLSTTTAGSGHPTSSLSATDLMATLLFGGFFHFDLEHPDNPNNDRLIFSKGHASPLFYSLYLAADAISPEEILTLRKFDSSLEGHPTPRFRFTEAATGSLGQGLSVGVGMALALRANIKYQISKIKNTKENIHNLNLKPNPNNLIPKVFVLLGDGETAEGSVWEAAAVAAKYMLNNLVVIVDVNRLGQSGETMYGWNTDSYKKKFEAFGWDTMVIDGHKYHEIISAFNQSTNLHISQSSNFPINQLTKHQTNHKPFAIIAKTIKGKGVSFLEDKEGWHGKPIPQDKLGEALKELGDVDLKIRRKLAKPNIQFIPRSFRDVGYSTFNPSTPLRVNIQQPTTNSKLETKNYKLNDQIATREAYGQAITQMGEIYPNIVALDGEVSNSTYSEIFKAKFPERFFEMYIAEQNMVGAAVGLARLGYVPFVSSFAAFLTRAFDQIRMAALGGANIKFCGSHAGVSIGEDGPSQMGLEDIAMFSSVFGSTILYTADAVSTARCVEELYHNQGIGYIRTTRGKTPVIYSNKDKFPIGGSKLHKSKLNIQPFDSAQGKHSTSNILIITAGITLFEALEAQKELVKDNIRVDILDCYSIKPIDEETIQREAKGARLIITVEDHWLKGGLGDAVLNVLADSPQTPVVKLAVTKMPRSGKTAELLKYEEIDKDAIIRTVKKHIR